MDNFIEYKTKLEIKKKYELIICGGGVAGVAAAVSACCRGISTLLIEKSNILGGLGTLGLVNYFVPMCNGRGKQIIFGLAEKWLRMSAETGYDTIPSDWKNGEPEKETYQRYTQTYPPYIFAMQLLDVVKKAGADVLFDCAGVTPVMENKKCTGVITFSKSNLEYYACDALIDTTGDGDLMRACHLPTVRGENFFSYFGKMLTLDTCKRAYDENDISKAYTSIYGGGINLFGDNQPDDVPKYSGLAVEEVSDYLIKNQLIMLEKLKKDKNNTRDVAMMPMMPNFRTTCRIDGDYTLSVYDCYKHFDDSIGAINDFEHKDHLFEVPYRTLIRSGYENIITAGRSASGTGYGWDLLRVIPPAIITGQAAGNAAALAIKEKTALENVDIKKLQNSLEEENVMIHFPDSYVPEDKSVVIHGKKVI